MKIKKCLAIALMLCIAVAGRSSENDKKIKAVPYPTLESLAKELKTSRYSGFENPTGIFYTAGEIAILNVGNLNGEEIKLRVHNFGPGGEDSVYDLQKGVNQIEIKNQGLAYIVYYTPNWKKAQPVKIEFKTGKACGYFDSQRDDNEQWKTLLSNTSSDILDIRGKYVQLAYDKESLRKYCPSDGLALINLYDSIIHIQFEIMGLTKYNRVPKNRMFGRVIWKGFMHADGMGAAFHQNTMKNLASPELLINNTWGVAHEFGHVNQTRPGMKWVSTTEVTNNIFSAWTQFLFSPNQLRLEHEVCKTDNGKAAGARFNWYLNSALVNQEQWLCQKGPDKMTGYENGGDHFVKLGPLWQLQLYYGAARMGNPDLYADVFEKVRNTDESNLSNGQLQINFMKNACDAQKEDLTDFFIKAGMLKPIDKNLDDYSRGQLTITSDDCEKLVTYAKRYPKPQSPVIYYINGNCVDAFKNKLPVSGRYNEGLSTMDGKCRITHQEWKNVCVFETYKGKELTHVAIYGTDSADLSFTTAMYPTGSTRIEAVAWDGTRTLVIGTR